MLQKCRRHPIQRSRKDDPEIVSPRRFLAPPFDVKRWHNRLRCQSSLAFGGMTWRPATAFASLRSPQATARKLFHYDVCGSLSRAVRRRPTAADCNSPMARACPPPSANSMPKNENAVRRIVTYCVMPPNEVRIGISTEKLSLEIPFIFLFVRTKNVE